MTVVVFGSINLDLIFGLPHIPAAGETVLGPAVLVQPGGKGANQAVAAARDGARVLMAGAIGDDVLAAGALGLLRSGGVDVTRVATVAGGTGCAAILVDPTGENAIAVGSGANLAARAAQVEDAVLGPAMTLVLQMEVPAAENAALIARAKAAGARVVLNLAPAGPLPEDTLRQVDVLVVNETEATWLGRTMACEASAAALHARLNGVAVVLTRGGDGVDVAAGGKAWRQDAWTVQTVDTTAAGDCFTGVLAHRLDQGDTLEAAIARANAAAGFCCTRHGSQSSLPTADETDAFLAEPAGR